jgi:hypothetical protein
MYRIIQYNTIQTKVAWLCFNSKVREFAPSRFRTEVVDVSETDV